MAETMIERVAARMWKAEAEDAGAPASVPSARTPEAFAELSEEHKGRWCKFARAAIEAMRIPTGAMVASGGGLRDWDSGTIWENMIDAALSEGGE